MRTDVTLTVTSNTILTPADPISTTEDLIRLYLRDEDSHGAEVLIWIARSEVVRLIGAITAAAGMPVPAPDPWTPAADDPVALDPGLAVDDEGPF